MIDLIEENGEYIIEERANNNDTVVTIGANPALLKFNRLGYGIQEIPIFL